MNTNYIEFSEGTILDNLFKELLKDDYNKIPKEAVLHLNNVFRRFVAIDEMMVKYDSNNNFYLKNYVMNNESSGKLIKEYKLEDFKFFTTNKNNLSRIRGSII